MERIRAGVIGGAGYTGGELVRLLVNHPAAQLTFVHSRSNAGKPLASVHAGLEDETDLAFSADIIDADVLFLCLGHGEARKFLQENHVAEDVRIIDLSQDFRLRQNARFAERDFIYGLPELYRDQIRTARNIANPGCFATAIQLGLLPLAKAGILQAVYTTGITGSTGAGQGLSSSSHFSWRANNIQAYKTLTHQHVGEITASLTALQPAFSNSGKIHFIPWRGDFPRGIFISSQLHCTLDIEEVMERFRSFYAGHPFVSISSDPIFMKQVVNTNKCLIQIEMNEGQLVVHSVIDNLLKGASGQAVQNMNVMFGLEETAGLKLKALAF